MPRNCWCARLQLALHPRPDWACHQGNTRAASRWGFSAIAPGTQGTTGQSPRRLPRPWAGNRPDDQEEHHRATDRDQPRGEVEEVAQVAYVERARDEAADQGSQDPDRERADA